MRLSYERVGASRVGHNERAKRFKTKKTRGTTILTRGWCTLRQSSRYMILRSTSSHGERMQQRIFVAKLNRNSLPSRRTAEDAASGIQDTVRFVVTSHRFRRIAAAKPLVRRPFGI